MEISANRIDRTYDFCLDDVLTLFLPNRMILEEVFLQPQSLLCRNPYSLDGKVFYFPRLIDSLHNTLQGFLQCCTRGRRIRERLRIRHLGGFRKVVMEGNRVPDAVRKKNPPLPRPGQNKRGLLVRNGLPDDFHSSHRGFREFVYSTNSLFSDSLFIQSISGPWK